MITYHCDQCGSKVSPGVRYTAVTTFGVQHFCSVICVSSWAIKCGYREIQQDPKPPGPMMCGICLQPSIEDPDGRTHADGSPLCQVEFKVSDALKLEPEGGTFQPVPTHPQGWPDSGSTGIQAAAGPYGAPEVFAPTTAALEPEAAPHRLQDAVKHTCVICGREGTRRYVHSSIGWRCAATATACPGNRKPLPSDIRPKAIQADVTPAVQVVLEPVATPARAAQGATPVTARCGGCSRTWNLTGRVLTAAVSFHEHQHEGHMVEVLGVDA